MEYRPLGRSGLRVSAVAFGTCQLRLVSEEQALATLKRGFELGVNMVHTAPDYDGAEDLVARAVRESGRDVMVFSQGYGDPAHFEYLFESACRRLGKRRLEMFGIACIEDRAHLGEDVWGPGGAIAFLQRKKAEGRLGGIFCTTHGSPEYVARLVTSGCFDAIMLAYNPLGFHLLSGRPDPPRLFEDMSRSRQDIFPMAARLGVGLMVMKPLAGGLLCPSKAFPPRAWFAGEGTRLSAGDILRTILQEPEVSCVVPGTASPEEAEENARAGHWASGGTETGLSVVAARAEQMRAALCSRCGGCEPSCSQHLPVSWLFRDAYIQSYPSETYEAVDQLRYFHLHPGQNATCSSCQDVTCSCPAGIDIPGSLQRVHDEMLRLRDQGLLPSEAPALAPGGLAATVVARDIPEVLEAGQVALARLYVENAGARAWAVPQADGHAPGVVLAVTAAGTVWQEVPVRHVVEPGARTHFVFSLRAPQRPGEYPLRFTLMTRSSRALASEDAAVLTSRLTVPPAARPDA
jgi:predicted aldo/keto reductase-like oxidoreductase